MHCALQATQKSDKLNLALVCNTVDTTPVLQSPKPVGASERSLSTLGTHSGRG
jgi:hypothetical protein